MAKLQDIINDYNNQRGCLYNLAPDEDAFILQGGDQFSAELVGLWAERVREAANNLPDEIDGMPNQDKVNLLLKADEAKACSARMLNFPGRKLPSTVLPLSV